MPRISCFVFLLLCLALPGRAAGQSWRPPVPQMPQMPLLSELEGDWLGARAPWFGEVEALSGVPVSALQAAGEPRSGAKHLRIARFSKGMLPVVVWSDRNGDTRSDMIEIYKTGGVIIQLIDADFDGEANVIRYYDATGALLREERMDA